MSFPVSPLALVVEIQVGEVWEDITGYVLTEEDVTISRGRADWAEDVDPGECGFILDNRGGRFSPRNPRSEYFGRLTRNTPVRVGVRYGSAILWRFHGEVSAWPSRWDLSQNMQWAPIKAFGPLRRWRTANTPLKSALQRYILASSPRAYWPLDDGPQTQNARAEVGGNIMYVFIRAGDQDVNMAWAQGSTEPWLEPMAVTPDSASAGEARGYVRGGGKPQSWHMDFVRSGRGGNDYMEMECEGAGTDADPSLWWGLYFNHANSTMAVSARTVGETMSSLGLVGAPISVSAAFQSSPVHVRLSIERVSASSTRWTFHVDGTQRGTGTFALGTRPLVRWRYSWSRPESGDSETVGLGHVTVWEPDQAPPLAAVMSAFRGHPGESAGERMTRVCEEARLPLSFVGAPADTQLVGPQGLVSPLECVQEAARADGGILYESREALSLVYRTSRSRYNRGHVLETSA